MSVRAVAPAPSSLALLDAVEKCPISLENGSNITRNLCVIATL